MFEGFGWFVGNGEARGLRVWGYGHGLGGGEGLFSTTGIPLKFVNIGGELGRGRGSHSQNRDPRFL